MKIKRNAWLLSLLVCTGIVHAQSTYVYRQELEDFKTSSRYEVIFDKNANEDLRCIQRDIENYKQLSLLQRYIRSAFLSLDSVAISSDTMPKLYAYIDAMCKKEGVTTPTVFVTRQKEGFFNAAAQKLLISSGAIIIGHELLLESTDAELEAVVAHEIGHVKYNHINKTLGIYIASVIASAIPVSMYVASCPQYNGDLTLFDSKLNPKGYKECLNGLGKGAFIKVFLPLVIAGLATHFIINKSFEEEADEFAFKDMDKGDGLIEFFKDLENREKSYDNGFGKTYEVLQKDSYKLAFYDSWQLTARYYFAEIGHAIDSAYNWVYYNTPLGAHPSPAERIKTVKAYLAVKAKS